MEPYERLAYAIVLQAAEDYEYAISILHTKAMPRGFVLEAQRLKGDCEKFFCSKYFDLLTSVDPQYLAKNIESMVINSPQMIYNEDDNCFECVCGKKINMKLLNGSKPIIRCKECDTRIRVWGVPI